MRNPDRSRQRGLALILVLWVLSLMTIMAGSFALSTQREATLLSHAHERAKAVALADGAIYYTMLMLSLPDPKQRWRADGTPYSWNLDGARVRIRILDEAGKIDLNAAQEPTLRTVFKLVLGDEDRAQRLADAILDWRDGDELKRPYGAEASDYEAAESRNRPQNRNFLVMEELRGVLGMTPELYRLLQPWVTLYSGQDGLNPAKASREVLTVLAGGDSGAVASFIEQRQSGAPANFPPVPGLRFNAAADLAYTVIAEAEIAGQRGLGVRAIIKRGQGPDGAPFTFLSWKPRILPAAPMAAEG